VEKPVVKGLDVSTGKVYSPVRTFCLIKEWLLLSGSISAFSHTQ